MRPLLLLLLLLPLLSSCEEPPATFDAFPLPRAVNLARVLGPAPVLLGEQDTMRLRLYFDAATGFTNFSVKGDSTAQSWFRARAFRFRGLYYLVEERPDSGCWVHAVRIGRGQVQGLGTGYEQMLDLSLAARQGRWPALVRFRSPSGDSVRLRFDRRQLRAFYAAEVDSFAIYGMATTLAAGPNFAPAQTAGATQTVSLYPNPASATATILFQNTTARQVQLYDERGQLLQSYATAANQLSLPVADLPAGIYLVRIRPAGRGAATTLRLVVAH